MRTARVACDSNIYHVIARGVGQQILFEDENDKLKFVSLMQSELTPHGKVFAWCLMSNHTHTIIRMAMTDLSLSMGKLLSRYAIYFNHKYGRTGHLFQERFMSEPIETDERLLTTIRYVHRNPEKSRIAKTALYRWSSYGNYTGSPGFCDTDFVLDLLSNVEGFERFHLQDDGCTYLDIPDRKKHPSDDEALMIARDVLGGAPANRFEGVDKRTRDDLLRRLKATGIRISQIQRLTGIGRSIISRA